MQPLHIAAASEADYEWCARLMATSEPWMTLRRDLEGCRAALTRPGTELFLARDERAGQRFGFILLAAYGFAASPYVASIGVAPESRGRSVGSQLMAFAEQRYVDRGHLFLLVSSFNPRAQSFYRERGYQFVGELKEYIIPGHSELIFHKRLP
ncbi:MAG TPA: N-acetyltransferase [Candidatus Sulfotelmatobacter sp.]|nr:N-acetyltransferase [Candidatus Sulfotelmatobacter sp.]